MTDIVTFGEVLAEFMATRVNQSLGEAGPFAGPYPGGAPAIFIDQAAKLGSSAALVSAVGDDDFGRMLVTRLAADGVETSAIATLPDQTTASAFVTYSDDGSRDFIFNIANGACAHIEPSQFDAPLEGCQLFHVVGCSLFSEHMIELAISAVAQVKAQGGQVSFDPNVRKEIMDRPGIRAALDTLLSSTDILLPSDNELNLLAGVEAEDAAVARALELGVREIVLKRGGKGSCYFDSGARRELAGFKVDEVDPTGAGDTFGATYCVMRSQGMAAEEALHYANAAGACAVSQQGAMEGTSSRAELDAFIAARR